MAGHSIWISFLAPTLIPAMYSHSIFFTYMVIVLVINCIASQKWICVKTDKNRIWWMAFKKSTRFLFLELLLVSLNIFVYKIRGEMTHAKILDRVGNKWNKFTFQRHVRNCLHCLRGTKLSLYSAPLILWLLAFW